FLWASSFPEAVEAAVRVAALEVDHVCQTRKIGQREEGGPVQESSGPLDIVNPAGGTVEGHLETIGKFAGVAQVDGIVKRIDDGCLINDHLDPPNGWGEIACDGFEFNIERAGD